MVESLGSTPMKIEFYQTFAYLGSDQGASWPAPSSVCDPEWARATYDCGFDQCAAAVDYGFDTLTFAEHHYSPKQLSPNPVIMASLAGTRFPSVDIGVFGTDLPINNPVRVAEEYAMLDNLLGGRLRVGLLRGTPNEYLTYFDNPWESREKFEEGTLLLQACWTEREPFGWEGRYYRYRNISLWPRVVQSPHPRILISGNSADGAIFAGKHGFDVGFSYLGLEKAKANLDLYHAAAAAAGWSPTPDNVQYRHWMWVEETDEGAWESNNRFAAGGLLALFGGATPDKMGAIGKCGGAMNGFGRGVHDTSGLAFPEGPPMAPPPGLVPDKPYVGTPDSVLARIAELKAVLNPGRFEVHFGLAMTPIPHEETMRTLKLAAEEIVPAVHAEAF
jgi:alkanesulfonate monooxygenase SsuD/methylene tetrahydromethanopterin reductase-like flavin-dependent oxidoreductase (luciferase family)